MSIINGYKKPVNPYVVYRDIIRSFTCEVIIEGSLICTVEFHKDSLWQLVIHDHEHQDWNEEKWQRPFDRMDRFLAYYCRLHRIHPPLPGRMLSGARKNRTVVTKLEYLDGQWHYLSQPLETKEKSDGTC